MTPRARRALPEVWGGVECTVNRVGDVYFDQRERSGHASRLSDLDLFAEIGLRTLRYPVLWEKTAPSGIDRADWRWPDERLGRLRELGIRPIVGLVHHGSGPPDTSLVDDCFAPRLGEYAEAVARRYPWVTEYTPINEPLTTARFAGLYGHWYPHGKSDREFLRALLTECRATVLAMRAIRKVNPDARLIQTEDIAHVDSTETLRYQADFENQRRYLSFDLLCGRVTRDHPLWCYLMWAGAEVEALDWLADNPCPPDVLGLNYYPTSERFLDDRLEHYPPDLHGGNGRHAYVDVETVRVSEEGLCGLRCLLRDTWERYERPMAVTECHLGCSEDERLRWLAEAWCDAAEAFEAGIPLEGFTVWSLLGAYDWDSLVTQSRNSYEPGIFDVSSGNPEPTSLVPFVRSLAQGHPDMSLVPAGPGWWRRPERLLYPPVACTGREGWERFLRQEAHHPSRHPKPLEANFAVANRHGVRRRVVGAGTRRG